MTIIGVVLNKLMSSKCMSTKVLSYESFASMASDYKTATLVLQLDDDSFMFIDMHKLSSEQPMTLTINDTVVPVSTWEQLQTYLNNLEEDILQRYLTTTIVPRYWQVGPNFNDIETTYRTFQQTPFFSNIGTQLRIRSVENTIGLDVEYCDHNDFYERGKSTSGDLYDLNWYHPDISIINRSVKNTIDFNNSIPIVNGIVFYPEVRVNEETGNTELIAYEAGRWIAQNDWNQANVKSVKHNKIVKDDKIVVDHYKGGEPPTESAYCYNKNIVLIDFSPFGNIEVIKLSDCVNGKVEYGYNDVYKDSIPNVEDKKQDIHRAYLKGNVERPYCSYYNIKFDLPAGTEKGIPIVCIGGRLFYLKEDSEIQYNENSISLSVKIDRELYHNIILANLQGFGKQITGTTFVEEYAKATLDELFVDTPYGQGTPEEISRLLYEDITIPFVIMLHTDKELICTKTKPIMTVGPDKFLFPPYAGGLLVNKRTREIVDYVRQHYGSYTLLETAMLRPINFTTKDYKQITKNSLAFEFNKYKSKSKYKHFDTYECGRDLEEYELIDFAYKEN